MFGKTKSRYPRLAQLIERGVLLPIDIAYGETQEPSGTEKEIAHHAALLSLLRKGHLILKKSLIEDPELASMIDREMTLPKYLHVETEIVSHLRRLLDFLPEAEGTIPLQDLTEEQCQAVSYAQKHPISLITGGPGTGKTYTASRIVQALRKKTILTAPTGKATANLEKNIDFPVTSGTLHSILQVRSPLDHQKEVDYLDAELVIVDECSMIDPLLFARLLAAIGPDTHLVLMGDVNQLPAVEGGSIFADLIDADQIKATRLTKCMRSDRAEILNLAEAILSGENRELRNIDLGFEKNDLETIYSNLWNHVKEKGFSTFRILSTLRKGPLGVDALNRYLFEKFSAMTDHFPIMIKRNDPKSGLANGDTGILIKGKCARIGDREFSLAELPAYEYAYCISVHKSQGSEYDHVLFLVPEGSESFGREVLYTAVTRAKLILEIDGAAEPIAKALARSSRKASTLVARLKN